MKHKVLEGFYYAIDGKNAAWLEAGSMEEIRDEHVERFVGEGKIEEPVTFRLADHPVDRVERVAVDEDELADDEYSADLEAGTVQKRGRKP